MPSRSHAPDWVLGLRNQLRATVGTAYGVGEQRGQAKLDVRFADGSRATAVLPVKWLPAQAGAIQRSVESISQAIASGRTLKESLAFQKGEAIAAPEGVKSSAPLIQIWEDFGKYKVNQIGEIKQTNWETVYTKTVKHLSRAENAVVVMSEAPFMSPPPPG